MRMKLKSTLLPAASLLLLVAVLSLGSAASTAAQDGGTSTSGGSAVEAPQGWSGYLAVSSQPYYDNGPSIAASRLDAGVTVAWEERDEVGHTFGAIQEASNTGVGRPHVEQRVGIADWKAVGNVQARSDSLGRRHIVYYRYASSTQTCGYYAMVEANGQLALVETIPNSCGGFFKRAAVAAGPDNSVHVLLGRDNQSVYYFHRNTAGAWDVQNNLIVDEGPTGASDPTAPAIAVSTNGVVMAAWLQRPGSKYDVFTAVRLPTGLWQIENTTNTCCTRCEGDANTYSPSLAADFEGGIRMAWADEQCNPRTTPRSTDMYYREWRPGTGWAGQPLVLVDGRGGQQFYASIDVDGYGVAHIGYSTDEGHPRDEYRFAYASGRGTTFTTREIPYFGSPYWQKETTLARGLGYIFEAFTTNEGAPQYKTLYYVSKDIPDTGGGSTPTPTATPPPSPPRCEEERFTDVCPGDFFYTSTLALDDLAVISGYSTVPPCDGPNHIPCFKPFNNITRGQAAKVIVLGANLPANLQGAPHFIDVPPTHTFYNYIEYAYNAGVIGGYPCGGPGEPCDPGNRAYFRVGNNLTRGQLSKMTAEAFGFDEPVSGQTFEDVPPINPFYQWIERIASRGIIGGYPCGGQFEPCLPGDRPYFRPNANVTRGQASKIVYGAIEQSPGLATGQP